MNNNNLKSHFQYMSSMVQSIWVGVLLILLFSNSTSAINIFDTNFWSGGNQPFTVTHSAVTEIPSISINNVSMSEGGIGTFRAFVFTISLSAASDQPVSVYFSTADGTAVAREDYGPTDGTLTFAPGETIKSPRITVVGDNVIEPDETFTVNLSNAVNATISGGTGTGTILNDDRGGYAGFSSSNNTVNENAGIAVVRVYRLSGEASGVSVDYSTSDGTAIAGQDYTPTSGTLTFAANEVFKTFTVSILNDSDREQSETINLTLSNPNGLILNSDAATLTILDDEMPAFSISGFSDREYNSGTNAFNFTVSLSSPSSETTKVDFATANGSATAPSDYQATSGTLIFPPGTTSQIITVLVNGDTQPEQSESFTVNLSNAVNATILNARGTGTIQDDDTRDETPSCTYTVSATNINVGAEASSRNTFSVSTRGGVSGCYFSASTTSSFITINSSDGLAGNGGTVSFSVAANTGAARTGTISFNGYSGNGQFATITVNQAAGTTAVRKVLFDFDGDGKTDIAVFRPSDGYWYISKSSGGYSFLQWGKSGDRLVPGDYDGDGKTDLAVNRIDACLCLFETANTWFIRRSSDDTFLFRKFGRNASSFSEPMPADYDGDGKTDFAFYDSSDAVPMPGNFRIVKSSTDSADIRQWGLNSDRRVPADYDGDGKADLAVYRSGTWFILQSSDNAVRIEYFGLSSDLLVPADYDGDGRADLAVWRPSNGYWYYISSRDKSFNSYQFGMSADKPVPGDYDGDGKTDFAVFRPANGVWYLQQSSRGFRAEQFGLTTDVPIPNISVR